MIYVFDNSSLIDLFDNFYESRFPTLWKNFENLVSMKKIISVREVANEIKRYKGESRLIEWLKKNSIIFIQPIQIEYTYIQNIFDNEHFRNNIVTRQKILEGHPVADPFVVAKAKAMNGTVVTQEIYKENSGKIPNVCEFLNVKCTNLEGFMEKEKWEF